MARRLRSRLGVASHRRAPVASSLQQPWTRARTARCEAVAAGAVGRRRRQSQLFPMPGRPADEDQVEVFARPSAPSGEGEDELPVEAARGVGEVDVLEGGRMASCLSLARRSRLQLELLASGAR